MRIGKPHYYYKITGGFQHENEIKINIQSKYRSEYHIVFAPKYRRKVIYKELRADIGQILRKLCAENEVEIIEANLCPDHIHMLVSIFDRHANLKYKYGQKTFWARGYYIDIVGKNEKVIKGIYQKSIGR